MRLAMAIDYTRDPRGQIDTISALEDVGLDMVWVPEAWGYDAPSVMGYLAARTQRMAIASGILPVHTRTPALIAQTAAGLDALSGGRFELGLGTSGPQVIEGFHGVGFDRPKARLRETVAVCRLLWSGASSRYEGSVVRLPLPEGQGTGLGRPLRLLVPGGEREIPVHLAVMRPGMVELAAELADGWYPLFFVPGALDTLWGPALARGRARRSSGLAPLEITTSLACAIGDESSVALLRESVRPEIARYVGGMGARGRNFYTDVVGGLGWPDAARTIQDHYLDGRRDAAAAAIPDDMLRALTLCGPESEIAERISALRDADVRTLIVRPLGADPEGLVRRLRAILDRGGSRS
jgi:F420-dependent oxidoreductase-like protein